EDALLLHVAHQFARVDFGAVHVALGVGGDAFRGAAGAGSRALFRRTGIRDEGRDLAVLRAADAQPAPEARVLRDVRFGIGDVDDVVLVDEHTARPTELPPLREKFSLLVENLNAAVGAIGNEQPSLRIHGEPVRHVVFAWAYFLLSIDYVQSVLYG